MGESEYGENPSQILYDSMEEEDEDDDHVLAVQTAESVKIDKRKHENDCEIEIESTNEDTNNMTVDVKRHNELNHTNNFFQNHVSYHPFVCSNKETENRPFPFITLSLIKHKSIKCTDCHQVFFVQKNYTRHMKNSHLKYPVYDGKGNLTRFFQLQKLTLSLKRLKTCEGSIMQNTKRTTLWKNAIPKLILRKKGEFKFHVIRLNI